MLLNKKLSLPHVILGLSLVFFTTSTVSAVPTIDTDVNEDLYFPDGVLIMGVEKPENSVSTTGSSKVTIGGIGTVTVGNKRGGGLPRITLIGGTSITSTRAWSEEDKLRVSWWEGQFSAPAKSRMPQNSQIDYPEIASTSKLQVMNAFSFGLANESFSFSPAATVAFGVKESDGKKLWIAYQGADNRWKIDGKTSCIVKDQICIASIASASSVAIVREVYGSCPISSIENGKISSPPACAISCDNGYFVDDATQSCLAITEEMKNAAAVDNSQYGNIQERKQYTYRQGYFRYAGTREAEMRKILSERSDQKQGDLNRGYYSRNPRGKEEQVNALKTAQVPTETDSQRDSFLNYIQQMRNKFGAGSSANRVVDLTESKNNTEEIVSEDKLHTDEENAMNNYHSSGVPLLPSTGAELFIAVGAVVLFMMIIIARRRN